MKNTQQFVGFGKPWGESVARCFRFELEVLGEEQAVKLMPIPEHFVCPMSLVPMVDPVLTVDGSVYDRKQIEQWIRQRRQLRLPVTSPSTGLELPSATLMPAKALQKTIETYLDHRPEFKIAHTARNAVEKGAKEPKRDSLKKQDSWINVS